MRKMPKKFISVIAAATLSLGALALPACSSFQPLSGDTSGAVDSNGGFVVKKGNYYYFINGVETHTADNTYGEPVKGALMRISANDLNAKKNTAEIVVPSLMVAGDYSAGIFVYGDRVYFATPNTVKNAEGVVENSHLTYQSAKLDGSDVQTYITVTDNSLSYRYVEVEGKVYLLYVENSELHSYNTAAKVDTALAKSVGEYVLNASDKTDPYVYYTMKVTPNINKGDTTAKDYNQVYRVRADATKPVYEYDFSEYEKEHDGETPYTNLGSIVFDGIGWNAAEKPTQFNPDLYGKENAEKPSSSVGYSYKLQSYTNGGIYFTRSNVASTDSVGDSETLFYLPVSALQSGWNSVSGNTSKELQIIKSADTATSSAIYYMNENQAHCYLYVQGSNIFRAEIDKATGESATTRIATNVSGAILVSIDSTSDAAYKYVYYTLAGTSGLTVNRAVYNGSEENYKNLNYAQNEAYRPVQVLNVEHANGWYDFEMVDGKLFFADNNAYSVSAFNYVAYADLTQNGAMMNNGEIAKLNEKLNKIVDAKTGYLAELDNDNQKSISNAIKYYFYWGNDGLAYLNNDKYSDSDFNNGYLKYEATQFVKNVQEAIDEGKKETYLYGEDEKTAFKAYVDGASEEAKSFVDEKGVSYRTYNYFVNRIGRMSETDVDGLNASLRTALQAYTAPEEEESAGLPAWAWVLIGVGCGVVVAGVVAFILLRLKAKKHSGEDEAEERLYVDTTDDKDVDVYAEMEEQQSEEVEEEIDEPTEESVEEEEQIEEEASEEAETAEPADAEEDEKIIPFPTLNDSENE